jgi:hypothetical protein
MQMGRVAPRSLAPLLAIGGLAACGGEQAPPPPARAAAAKPPIAAEAQLGRPATVPAQANIFGAGRDEPPAPGGGGPGVLPPVWRLSAGSHRLMTVPAATGRVNPILNVHPENSPAGSGGGLTDVDSYEGISGVVHRSNTMFLVGVFLTDDPPFGHAPPRLDFTRRERFRKLSPRIGQTFLIGDGKGRSYRVPARATRLFLGFADARYFQGDPGWYGNNAGELSVTVAMKRGSRRP